MSSSNRQLADEKRKSGEQSNGRARFTPRLNVTPGGEPGITPRMHPAKVALGTSLGLRVRNRVAFMNKIREGLDIKALGHLSVALALQEKELARYADISARTLSRRRKEGRLNPDESDRLARLAMLFEQATELFEGDQARAAHWFSTPKRALGGAAPIEYADTEPGAREVRDLMGRIEHGVFS